MASMKTVVLVCDLCGKEEPVTADGESTLTTHTVTVDGESFEAETCPDCWTGTVAPMVRLANLGRRSKPRTMWVA